MISKDLIFIYDNIDVNGLYDKTMEDNEDMVKLIPEIIKYEKGIWKEGKRKDKLVCKLLNIPDNLTTILRNLFLNKNDEIGFKIKIKKFNENNNIKLKLKLKFSNVIMKIFNFGGYIEIEEGKEIKTIVKVRYEIKSLLGEEINKLIYSYVENKLNNYFIVKPINNGIF